MHKKILSKNIHSINRKSRNRRSLKKRILRKSKSINNKQSRKRKGGNLYGTGIGSNCYDPNYSIYNTNLLKLFPYKA